MSKKLKELRKLKERARYLVLFGNEFTIFFFAFKIETIFIICKLFFSWNSCKFLTFSPEPEEVIDILPEVPTLTATDISQTLSGEKYKTQMKQFLIFLNRQIPFLCKLLTLMLRCQHVQRNFLPPFTCRHETREV